MRPAGNARGVTGMRAITFGTVLSVLLWATIAWCLLALRVVTGHDHLHLSSHDFGASLLGLDLGFALVALWLDRRTRDA